MIAEVNQAKEFLLNKFGSFENVPEGTYAVPTETNKGPAYMRVNITGKDQKMSGFDLWLDEEMTKSWYTQEYNK